MKLPLNCTVDYINDFLSNREAKQLYNTLIEEYKLDQSRLTIRAGGKLIKTDSFKILFVSKELKEFNSHPEEIHGKNYLWNEQMLELKYKVESLLDKKFDLAMCLYYPDGNYFAPYHSDQETSGYNTILPSLSLGEVRQFIFKDNSNEDVYRMDLAHGSLLVMGAHCQERYTHSLIKNPAYKNGRINITFREASFK
ncbi:hypothetical protein A9Q93_10740 [Nonlabens dokdonensis]|uniref:Fe2OG dioxygenase domain-containing protein n=1 Tax=Nonlabens dokdonensis TaxID=328515 RepID=A0A1Z8ANS2_9FLAO|nr:alpha-ketoglutarate-dependent dioxygenase AlkB [Nonlabens dokdonensis]OUS11981.1 hypothetical protein A9Q93_10740 [Nonlabens dokdonensis]